MEMLLNILFPPKCFFCGNLGNVFCKTCLKECQILEQQETTLKNGVKVFSCFEYEGLTRMCIKKSKFSTKQFAALRILALFGTQYAKNLTLDVNNYLVVTIPLNKERAHTRGFNQSQLIAENLTKIFGLKPAYSILNRQKDTHFQYKLDRAQRYKNMENAFTITEENKVKGQKILLVDDICTSGATFYEASQTLLKAGAQKVKCFSLAKKV